MNLGKQDLLGPQLPQHRLQLGTTNIIGERAEIELRSGAVQHANPEAVLVIFPATFTDRNAVARLIIRKEFLVDESPVGVHLVQLPEAPFVSGLEPAGMRQRTVSRSFHLRPFLRSFSPCPYLPRDAFPHQVPSRLDRRGLPCSLWIPVSTGCSCIRLDPHLCPKISYGTDVSREEKKRDRTYAAQKLNDISGTPTMDILTRCVSLRSNSRWPMIASSS